MTRARAAARFGEMLINAGVIDQMQLKSAQAHLEQWGGRLPKLLAERGFAEEDTITEALAKALRVPLVQIGNLNKDMAALRTLDAGFCEQHAVFPISLKDRVITVAMADPTEIDVVDDIAARSAARVQVQMASETQITNAIRKHYRGQEVKQVANRALKAVKRLDELHREDGVEGSLELDTSSPPPTGAAQDILDEMMGGPISGFNSEDLARLEAARVNQDKVTTILRALTDLLIEKGVMQRPRG